MSNERSAKDRPTAFSNSYDDAVAISGRFSPFLSHGTWQCVSVCLSVLPKRVTCPHGEQSHVRPSQARLALGFWPPNGSHCASSRANPPPTWFRGIWFHRLSSNRPCHVSTSSGTSVGRVIGQLQLWTNDIKRVNIESANYFFIKSSSTRGACVPIKASPMTDLCAQSQRFFSYNSDERRIKLTDVNVNLNIFYVVGFLLTPCALRKKGKQMKHFHSLLPGIFFSFL